MAQVEYVTFATVGALDAVDTWKAGAWEGLNYTQWYREGPVVGENRVIPGAPGRLEVDKELDELTFSQAMRFYGRKDKDGALHTDPFVGVMANFRYFRKHVLAYKSPRSVTFHERDGTTTAGSVQVGDWTETVVEQAGGDLILLTFDVTVAASYLVTP